MSYFFGIFPDEELSRQIDKSREAISRIFENQSVPVHYSPRDKYHITLHCFGDKLAIFSNLKMRMRLTEPIVGRLEMELHQVRLGFGGQRGREVLHMPVLVGAEKMRELVYQLPHLLGYTRDQKFIPHLTLGRVTKDSTEEEFANLTYALKEYGNSHEAVRHKIVVDSFYLVRSRDGNYERLKKFAI